MLPNRSQIPLLAAGALALVGVFAAAFFAGCRVPPQQSLIAAPRTPEHAAGNPTPAPDMGGPVAPIAQIQPATYYARRHPSYRLIDLGTFGGASDPIAINNSGTVIGSCQSGQGGAESFLWRNGRNKTIGAFSACGINDHGAVVGYKDSKNGLERPLLKDGMHVKALPIPPGAFNVYAYRINNRDEVIEDTLGNANGVLHTFIWSGGRLWPLWTLPGYARGQANAISDKGIVVGQAETAGGRQHACLWRRGHMVDIGTLIPGGISMAEGVNAHGEIVGTSSVSAKGSDLVHAFLWRHGRVIDLGAPAGWPKSGATAINDRGQVIGTIERASAKSIYGNQTRPFLWQRGRMVDLNSLIPAKSGWVLTDAIGINDRGAILGSGIFHGRHRACLLVPIRPKPAGLHLAKAAMPKPRVEIASRPKLRIVARPFPPGRRRHAGAKLVAHQKVERARHEALEEKKYVRTARAVHKGQPAPIPIGFQGTVGGAVSPGTYEVRDGNLSRDIYFGPHAAPRVGQVVRVRGVLLKDGTVDAASSAPAGRRRAVNAAQAWRAAHRTRRGF